MDPGTLQIITKLLKNIICLVILFSNLGTFFCKLLFMFTSCFTHRILVSC